MVPRDPFGLYDSTMDATVVSLPRTLPCDALAAFLTFCGHVVYRPYLSARARMFGLSPLEDQALAGALMWLTVTFAYLIPALAVLAPLLSGERLGTAEAGVS